MNTNHNSANPLHALFVVIERTACLQKIFAEGNYYTRHGLSSRLLGVWHVTRFRVRDWVTHVIRGAGRQFYQRRVFHHHSRPATTGDRCYCCDLKFKEVSYFNSIENGKRIRIEIYSGTTGRNTGSVSRFHLNSLGKWSETNGHYWTDTDTLWRTLHIPATSPLFSVLFESAFFLYQWSFLCMLG